MLYTGQTQQIQAGLLAEVLFVSVNARELSPADLTQLDTTFAQAVTQSKDASAEAARVFNRLTRSR